MLQKDDIIKDASWNEYIVQEPIWKWWMGYVLLIIRKSDNEKFALKTLDVFIENDTDHKALINEAKLATQVNHDNVIKYLYFHDWKEYNPLPPYIIMELADNNDLEKIITNKKDTKTFFPEEELLKLFSELINWMSAINDKLVHRDVKPQNILLKNNIIKISDFGISKIAWDVTRSVSFKWSGTLPYCAPEVFSWKENTIQMDIYSMWIIFFELATLCYPYKIDSSISDKFRLWKEAHLFCNADSAIKINPDLSPKISSIIQKMIEKKISDRYNSWDEIKKDLDKIEIVKLSKNSSIINDLLTHNTIEKTKETEKKLILEKQKLELKEKADLISFQFKNVVVNPIKEFSDELNTSVDQEEDKIRSMDYVRDSMHIKSKDWWLDITINMKMINESDFLEHDATDIFWNNKKIFLPPSLSGKGNIIARWVVINQSWEGFNIIVCESEEDIYWEWFTLDNKVSPLSKVDFGKPFFFPFNFTELKKEIHYVWAMHVFESKFLPLSSKKFIDFLTYTYKKS